jgi:hypothetical protein
MTKTLRPLAVLALLALMGAGFRTDLPRASTAGPERHRSG